MNNRVQTKRIDGRLAKFVQTTDERLKVFAFWDDKDGWVGSVIPPNRTKVVKPKRIALQHDDIRIVDMWVESTFNSECLKMGNTDDLLQIVNRLGEV